MIQVWTEPDAVLYQMSVTVSVVEREDDRLGSCPFHAHILKITRTSSRDNACLNTLIMSFELTKGSVRLQRYPTLATVSL